MSSFACRAAAASSLVLLAGLRAATAAPDKASLRHEYRQLVDRYRTGDTGAVVQLTAWPSSDLEVAADGLDCVHVAVCEAAAVLHLEAAVLQLTTGYWDSAGGQVAAGRMILRNLLLPRGPACAACQQDAPAPELTGRFAFSWHLAAGYLAQSRGFHAPAYSSYLDAQHLRPEDPEATLALATAVEAIVLPDGFGGVFIDAATIQGIVGEVSPAETRAGSSGLLDERQSPYRLRLLGHLQAQYRHVLAADPVLHEARLRLGRVLAASGQREAARVELRAVLAESRDPFDAALAHLCLARLAEAPEEAATSYRSAAEADPSLREAWLGLSETCWRMEDRPAARAALRRALADENDATLSAWVQYHLGRGRAFKPALAALRRLVLGRR